VSSQGLFLGYVSQLQSTSVLDLNITIVKVIIFVAINRLRHASRFSFKTERFNALTRFALHLHLNVLLAKL
jgi:hypothetical protein